MSADLLRRAKTVAIQAAQMEAGYREVTPLADRDAALARAREASSRRVSDATETPDPTRTTPGA